MPALEYICFRGKDITIRKGYKHLTTALLAESGFNRCPESENFKICLRTSGSSSIITTYRRESPENYLDKQKPLLEAVVLDSPPFNVIFGFNYHKDDQKDCSWLKGKALMEDSPHVKFVNPNPTKSFSEESNNLPINDPSLVEGRILKIEVDSGWNLDFSEDVMKLFLKSPMLLFPMKIEILQEILSDKWLFLRKNYQINLVHFGRYHRVSLYAQKAKHFLPTVVGSDIQGIIISIPEDQVSVKKTWIDAENFLRLNKRVADIEVTERECKKARKGCILRQQKADTPEGADADPVDVVVVDDDHDDDDDDDDDDEGDEGNPSADHAEIAEKVPGKRIQKDSVEKRKRSKSSSITAEIIADAKERSKDMPIIFDKTQVNRRVLILGMVYSLVQDASEYGQEFRDRLRCEQMEKVGFEVNTMDDKHEPDQGGTFSSSYPSTFVTLTS
jgi:hypothetical protein